MIEGQSVRDNTNEGRGMNLEVREVRKVRESVETWAAGHPITPWPNLWTVPSVASIGRNPQSLLVK